MISAEYNRIEEVNKYLELDFTRNSEFQNLVDLAAKLCGTPVAILTLLGKEHNYLKVRSGVEFEVMPRETSFCQYAIEQSGVFIIPDASKDSRFDDNPLVQSDLHVRFYAGAPLTLSNGAKLGTLCLFDLEPNNLTDAQQTVLMLLSRQATSFMELELGREELKRQITEKEEKNQLLMKIASLQSHQIRQPLTSIMGLANLVKNGHHKVDDEWLKLFGIATDNFDSIIQTIVAETFAEKDLKAIRFYRMVEEIEDCAILLLDKNGFIENWNKGAKKIKGYKAREVLGKHFSIFYTDHDRENHRPERLIDEAERKGVARDEGWRIRKNGDKFWGSVVITAIHDNDKNVIGFTKYTRDLTDITNIRESLNASAELNQYLTEQINKVARVGGWELDLLKNELTWTSVTKQIHGVDDDYVPDLNTAINFYKEGYNRDKISELVKLAIVEGQPWDIELQLINRQGKELWIRSTGKSNFKDGSCTKVYGTCQDINKANSY